MLPVVFACIVAAAQLQGLSNWINNAEVSITQLQARGRAKNGRVAKYVILPATGGSLWLWRTTAQVSNDHSRAGVRAAAFTYIWAAIIAVVGFVALIIIWIVVALAILGLILWAALSALGGEKSTNARRNSFSFFATECGNCGSREHPTADCPHGVFSSECGSCGSKNHSTSDCPHGMFSSKCASCGSVDHSTDACPHGLFSSECGNCGSKSHATANCPHGLFSTACANCGSVDHATDRCPQ